MPVTAVRQTLLLGGARSPYSALLRKYGAAGIWLLQESSGTPADGSGNNRLLTVNGAPAPAQAGPTTKLAKSVGNFSNSDYLSSADAAFQITGALTVGAWAKTPTPSSSQTLMARDSDSGGRNFFFGLHQLATGPIEFYFNGAAGNDSVAGATTLLASTWYFLVAVFNPGVNLTVYVNGLLDGTSSGTPDASMPIATCPLEIGRRTYSTSHVAWAGQVAGAFIAPAALTATQIAALYRAS